MLISVFALPQGDEADHSVPNKLSLGYDRFGMQDHFGLQYQHGVDSLSLSIELKVSRDNDFPVPEYRQEWLSGNLGFGLKEMSFKPSSLPILAMFELILGYQDRSLINNSSEAIKDQPYSREQLVGAGYSPDHVNRDLIIDELLGNGYAVKGTPSKTKTDACLISLTPEGKRKVEDQGLTP